MVFFEIVCDQQLQIINAEDEVSMATRNMDSTTYGVTLHLPGLHAMIVIQQSITSPFVNRFLSGFFLQIRRFQDSNSLFHNSSRNSRQTRSNGQFCSKHNGLWLKRIMVYFLLFNIHFFCIFTNNVFLFHGLVSRYSSNKSNNIFNPKTSSHFVFDNFVVRRPIFMRFRSSDSSFSGDKFFIVTRC